MIKLSLLCFCAASRAGPAARNVPYMSREFPDRKERIIMHSTFWENLRRKYIGSKAFYAAVLALIVPIIIQNSISNFVNLLDNLMVGAVSESQMNGVSICNNLIFVFNLCIFGGMSGATIFAAQFFGSGDEKGVRYCFRFSLIVGAAVSALALLVLSIGDEPLISLWIHPESFENPELQAIELKKAHDTLAAGKGYLRIILLGLVPFAVTTAYAGILRVEGETRLPMTASIVSVLTNLTFNYVLINGIGDLIPPLYAKGAAIATVISRYVEMIIIVSVAHKRMNKGGQYPFLKDAYRGFSIPGKLFRNIFIKTLPLLLNECMWSLGMATLSRLYSERGLTVVNATTITTTLTNLFNVFFISMGTASAVLVGRSLGAEDWEGAKDNARKIIVFEEIICVGTCLLLLALGGVLPKIYTASTKESKELASTLIRISGLVLPITGFAHCTYFTLRAGGQTFITFLFDSVYTWLLPVPLAFLLIRFTGLGIVGVYAICSFIEFFKDILGYILLKKGVWIRNIVCES